MVNIRRYIVYAFLPLFMGLCLAGCSQEEVVSFANGTLRLSIGHVSQSIETRATPSQLGKPLIDRFKLKIQRTESAYASYDGAFVDNLELNVGTYTITAYHGEDVPLGKDCPYYEGVATATIEENQSASVTIPCRVANALVSVVFGRDEEERARFDKFYKDYGVRVRIGNHSIDLASDEAKQSIYFPAGSEPILMFYGTLKEFDCIVSCELLSDALPTTFEAAEHAIVTLTLPESELEVNIVKVEVETVSIEETIPLEWFPSPSVTAQHRYDGAGSLVGTDLDFSNAYPGMQWRAVVTNADGIEVRSVEGSGALSSSYDSVSAWPYLPSGDYTVTSYFLQGSSLTEGVSKTFSVGKPDLKASVDGYTSYSKYLEGDVDGANACERGTIYSPSVSLNVSEVLFSNGNYDCVFDYTYAGSTISVKTGKNSYSIANITGQAASATPYRLSASVTFDGVTVSAYKDFYITGLPVTYAPPTTENGWIAGTDYVSFASGRVRLGQNAWSQSQNIYNSNFAIPVKTKVALDYDVMIHPASMGTTLKASIGGITLMEISEKGGFLNSKDYAHKGTTNSGVLSNVGTEFKCENTYGLAQSCSYIYSLTLKYGE